MRRLVVPWLCVRDTPHKTRAKTGPLGTFKGDVRVGFHSVNVTTQTRRDVRKTRIGFP